MLYGIGTACAFLLITAYNCIKWVTELDVMAPPAPYVACVAVLTQVSASRAWQVILPEQMHKGFLNLVHSVDDLRIDVPDAPELIATFVARAVVDDILPPAFVDKLPSGRNDLLYRTLAHIRVK